MADWRFGFGKRRKDQDGFSEEALKGLAEADARLPPPDAYERVAKESAAYGGRPRPDKHPHYWGHRERLRQRFMGGGENALPEYEILELILFNGIPRVDVKPLAKRLLNTFGDLNGVIAAPEARLMGHSGMTHKAVIQLRLCADVARRMSRSKVMSREVLSSWEELMQYLHTALSHAPAEQFRVLFLDKKNILIADEPHGKGTVDHVPVYPREVVKRALELAASAVILVHNHPSGDPAPSDADIQMTQAISDGLATVGIRLHDHIIVGAQGESSFRELGYL